MKKKLEMKISSCDDCPFMVYTEHGMSFWDDETDNPFIIYGEVCCHEKAPQEEGKDFIRVESHYLENAKRLFGFEPKDIPSWCPLETIDESNI